VGAATRHAGGQDVNLVAKCTWPARSSA